MLWLVYDLEKVYSLGTEFICKPPLEGCDLVKVEFGFYVEVVRSVDTITITNILNSGFRVVDVRVNIRVRVRVGIGLV